MSGNVLVKNCTFVSGADSVYWKTEPGVMTISQNTVTLANFSGGLVDSASYSISEFEGDSVDIILTALDFTTLADLSGALASSAAVHTSSNYTGATIDVSLSRFQHVFKFALDSEDINDLAEADMCYWVNSNNVFTATGSDGYNLSHSSLLDRGSTTVADATNYQDYIHVDAHASGTSTQQIRHDFIRHLSEQEMGSAALPDIFNNVTQLLSQMDIATNLADVQYDNIFNNMYVPDASFVDASNIATTTALVAYFNACLLYTSPSPRD